MNNPFLVSKKIYLRAIEKDDLNENYQQWFNDEEICQFTSHHRFPNYKQNMEEYYKNIIKSNNNLILAIIDEKTEKHIGNISLQDINSTDRSAEFAIVIGSKKHWKKGIAKEAAKLIIEHGFKELNLHRIYCGTSAKNIGMQKLAKLVGFKKEGISREAIYKNNQYGDIIRYGLLKNEYQKQK